MYTTLEIWSPSFKGEIDIVDGTNAIAVRVTSGSLESFNGSAIVAGVKSTWGFRMVGSIQEPVALVLDKRLIGKRCLLWFEPTPPDHIKQGLVLRSCVFID